MFQIIIEFVKQFLWPAVKSGVLTGAISALEDQLAKQNYGRRTRYGSPVGRIHRETRLPEDV